MDKSGQEGMSDVSIAKGLAEHQPGGDPDADLTPAAHAAVAADAVTAGAADGEVVPVAESESAPGIDTVAGGVEAGLARLVRLPWLGWLSRLSRGDRAAIGVTIGAHAALVIITYYSSWIQGGNHSLEPLTGSGAFQFWDAKRYVNYAQHGLFSGASTPNNAALLPGYPLLLAFVHLLVRNWLASVLLLSLLAGCAAAVLLNRMAGSTRAGLFLFTAPAAVFLTVGYSEPVFLAFAAAAWYAAQRGEWSVASLFAGLAGLTRIDGLALIPALVLLALTRPGAARRLSAASGAAAAAVGPFLYVLYLRRTTGSWSAWQQASRAGWNLRIDWPWIAIRDSWRNAYEDHWSSAYYPWSWSFELELVCTIAAALLVIALLARHEWPEACYCALVLASMVCVNYQMGADRGLLVCFPLYLLLARAADRRPWIGSAYVWVSAPIALLLAGLYTTGNWAN
jgi:hypothetical protein